MRPHTKGSRTGLKVIFPNGEQIHKRYAYQTLIETIRIIGHDKVESLQLSACGVPLISNTRDDFYTQHELTDNVFVMTHTATGVKRNQLEEISKRLHLNLDVQIT